MARSDAPLSSTTVRPRDWAILTLPAVVAAAALLARHADGTSALPAWLEVVLQAPALLVWCRHRVFRRTAAGRTSDSLLTACVLVGGAALAMALGRVEAISAAWTAFIVGSLLVEWLCAIYSDVAGQILEPARLLRRLAGPWLVMVVLGTVLLSLPVATLSAVPDYRHNFLDHMVSSAFAAVSSACLVGTTVYSFGEEYAPFGQAVMVVMTQLSGMGFAAVGLAIVSPFMNRIVRLRTVLLVSVVLQLSASCAMWSSWRCEDAASGGERAWWGIVHAGSALWNSGQMLRDDGLATYLNDGWVFTCVTSLCIVGSLSLPVVLCLILGSRPRAGVAAVGGPSSSVVPWRSLPQWEAAAALMLFLTGAVALYLLETPWGSEIVWRLPDSWVPERPVDFGSRRVTLRDEMPPQDRWALSVFASGTLRSAGLQSMPVSAGAFSWPSYGLMLLWMCIGGASGGASGGLRTTALVMICLCVLSRRQLWRSQPGGEAGRRTLLRRACLFIPVWILLNALSIGLLTCVTDGSSYDVVFEGAAACSTVGLSTGLLLHLTPMGRVAMILIMIVGRMIPVAWWLGTSERFTSCLRARRNAEADTA